MKTASILLILVAAVGGAFAKDATSKVPTANGLIRPSIGKVETS